MTPAPIALFVYNRPWHARQTVEALLKNEGASASDLFIFSDGARGEKDRRDVDKVREYIRTVKGFKSVTIKEKEANMGLADSIISGVDEIVGRFGRIIVMEDDHVSSPYFLKFMNEGLGRYADEMSVASIHGYIYPLGETLPETFFIKGADCWGWATWKRAWDIFERDGSKLLKELVERDLAGEFDMDGAAGFYKMLENQVAGRTDSWAIRWHASAFLKGMLTLYPGRSLIYNIGNDSSGTHGNTTDIYGSEVSNVPIKIEKIDIAESAAVRDLMAAYHRRSHEIQAVKQNLFKRILNKMRAFLRKFTR